MGAKTVRAENPDAAGRNLGKLPLEGHSLRVARLGEARCQYLGSGDAVRQTLAQHSGDPSRGHADAGQIHRAFHLSQAVIHPKAIYLSSLGVNR